METKKKNFVEKTINFFLNILIFIFAAILLISIYSSVQTKVLGNDYTDFFGYSIFEVQTGSMADTINAGDWVIVKLTQKVKLDDIVTYELDGEYITHRVVGVYNDAFTTRGDANSANDEPIKQDKIVGKVVSILGNLGIIRKILFNPTVLASLIITLCLFNLAVKKNKAQNGKTNSDKGNNNYLSSIVNKIKLFFKKITGFKKEDTYKAQVNNLENYIASNTLEKYDEEDMDKTIFYRIIPVDLSEASKNKAQKGKKDLSISTMIEKTVLFLSTMGKKFGLPFEKVKKDITSENAKEIIETVKPNEDNSNVSNAETKVAKDFKDDTSMGLEPEVTSPCEVVSVDVSEIDDTLLEIAGNEMKEAAKKEKIKEKEIKSEQVQAEKDKVEVVEEETLTQINLDLLRDKKSKGKNTIDTVMLLKKEELNELINILVEDKKIHVNKVTIKDMFITSYIDAKYYNCVGDNNIGKRSNNVISKIEKAMKEATLASEVINSYHGKDTKQDDTVDVYASTLMLIANLEQAWESISDLKAKKEFYKKEIIKYSKNLDNEKIESLVDEIIGIQRSYNATIEYFMKKLDTNMFNLNLNKITSRKDMFGLELQHNVSFSKVYSDYIIDKTYTEGIVAEDKMTVLLNLLLVQLVKDMISSDFNRKYILHIPRSLYDKEKKLERILRMIDDTYAKDNVIILITLEDLLDNKMVSKRVRKMGYKFAIVFDREMPIDEKSRGYLYVADYIFVNKKDDGIEKMVSFVPEELLSNIIYEDIANKVGDFVGE